jgi:hemerythrin superfamily protein
VDIYRRLRQDHAWQRELANLILETAAADPDRVKLYRKFKREVESHANAEGQTLYPLVLGIPECHLLARRGMFGHQLIADLLRDLDKYPIDGDEWRQHFARLRNEVEYYACEEEESLFPEARRHLPADAAARVLEDYAARKSARASQRGSGLLPPLFIAAPAFNSSSA